MSRIADIFERVRDSLVDVDGDRWSNSRLLRLLDEAQKNLVIKAKLLRKRSHLPLNPNRSLHELPSDCIGLLRVTYNDKKVELFSHNEMDKNISKLASVTDWEAETGTEVKAIIYDKLNPKTIKTYPIITHSAGSWELIPNINTNYITIENQPYGEIVDVSDWEIEGIYGIVVDFEGANPYILNQYLVNPIYGTIVDATDYDFNSVYGSVVDWEGPEENYDVQHVNIDPDVDGAYGVCFDLEDTDVDNSDLTVYYLKRPLKLLDIYQELEVDEHWDIALGKYIIGAALLDNRDTQNQQISNNAFSWYQDYVSEAIEDSSNDFTDTDTQYTSTYNNGFS